MSQCATILEFLKRGESITPLSGYALCGSLAVHSRIAELRSMGHEITCKIVTRRGKRFGEYRLERKSRLR